MASSIPPNPTSHNLAQLIPRMSDADPDLRFMALNDLHAMLNVSAESILLNDYNIAAKLIDGLLHTMNDTHGEVQNQAVKCLGPFVNRIPESILCPMIDKVSQLRTENIVDHSIPALALRTIVVNLPRPQQGTAASSAAKDAYSAISRALMPRLVGYVVLPSGQKGLPPPPRGMIRLDLENGTDSNAIDVLTEVAACYGPLLQDQEVQALQKTLFEIFDSERAGSVLKKKAVTAMATLSTVYSDRLLSDTISHIIEAFRNPHISQAKRKLYITILGTLARSIPHKFGPYLQQMAQFVLSVLSEQELEDAMTESQDMDDRDPEADEVREAALASLEAFVAHCVESMRAFTQETIDAALRFLKYDPNFAGGDDDDDDMDAEEDEELEGDDFEEETGYDDEDDSSWKIRRTAAKVLSALIATRPDLLEDGTLYGRVAPALVSRFKEREESVRLEVLAALSLLVCSTSSEEPSNNLKRTDSSMMPPPSRKRRRGGSDASMLDVHPGILFSNGFSTPQRAPTPATGPLSSLSKLSPQLVGGVATLLKKDQIPTKQASIVLLKDLVRARRGGLEDSLGTVIDPIVEAVKTRPGSFASGASATSANTYRVQALQFLSAAIEMHPHASLAPYLQKTLPAVIAAAQERYSKVSVEAISTMEQLIKSISPPRNQSPSASDADSLLKLYEAIVNRISANDADLEVRQQAIYTLGLLLGLTGSSESLLSAATRKTGLTFLLDRLRNELTRLASVRAIDTVAALATKDTAFDPKWVQEVAVELAQQLRKASRALRGSSLSALRTLATNPVTGGKLETPTIETVVTLLTPILQDTQVDLHLLGPSFLILAAFVKYDAKTILTPAFVAIFGNLLKKDFTGHSLDAMLLLVTAVGESGQGKPMMTSLLQDVGVGGNPELTGKVIGALTVSGQGTVGVKIDDFVNELNTTRDEKRRVLALSVIGEAGLRLGPASSLNPELFTQYFTSKSDKVPVSAAVALGRAGAGNVSGYLPVILKTANAEPGQTYLLLHSIREVLQHAEAETEIIPYAKDLWDSLIVASQVEDNKAIGAECVGRLAVVDPKTYLPQLQTFLRDTTASTRGMVIAALRYTFADPDPSYDEYLRPIIVPMLVDMLNDESLDNRRLAVGTLNAAAHNKPELITPHLDTLIPLAVKDTVIRPELVRDVKMGPFTHKVDDGLELRKSAYQTLYSFIDGSVVGLSIATSPNTGPGALIPSIFDRTVAGVTDDHDIRMLCLLMLTKLVSISPEETHNRLERLCTDFKVIMDTKPKESAVKQELEKLAEAQRGVVKVGVVLSKKWAVARDADEGGDKAGLGGKGAGVADPQLRVWESFWSYVRKSFPAVVKAAEEEVREKER